MNFPILAYAAGIASCLPMLAGLVRVRALDREFRVLFTLFFINAINVGLQFYMAARAINNLWLDHFYVLSEFVLMTWVLSCWSSLPWRKALRTMIVVFVVFWLFAQFFLEPLDGSANFTSPVSNVLFTVFSIGLLHKISGDTSRSVLHDPRFWILAGLLILSSGGLMFTALRSMVDKLSLEGLLVIYNVHWGTAIVSSLLYTWGFLCKPLARNSGGQLELAQ